MCDFLLGSALPDGLRRLRLDSCGLMPMEISRLVEGGIFAGRAETNLYGNPLGDHGVRRLHDASGTLRHLHVGECGLTTDGLFALLASPLASGLAQLDAANEPLDVAAVRRLAEVRPRGIRRLWVRVADSARAEVDALVAAGAFAGVELTT